MTPGAILSVAAFGFEAPRWGLALPVACAALLLLERRLPGTARRRVLRLGLRTLALGLLVAALARPYLDGGEEAPRLLVVVRDEQALRTPAARAEAQAAAREAVSAARRAGVPAAESSSADGAAASLAAARLALPAGSTGTVLWLTDGRAAAETVRPLLEALARDGIRVEGLAVPRDVPATTARARVIDLVAPAETRGPFAARARIFAPGAAEVDLLVDGESVRTVPSPGAGERDVAFEDLEATAGPHEVAVRVRTVAAGEHDPTAEVARAVVRVGSPPRILAVVDDPQTSPTRRALSARGFMVAAVPATALGAALSAIPEAEPADAFLLDAAAASRASTADLEVIARRVEEGAGLFLEAGTSREAWEQLATGPLARVLPVAPVAAPAPPEAPRPEETPPPPEPLKPDPSPGLRAERRPEEALPISLLLVIDRSGSMAGGKLAMAIEGARRAASTLSEFDRAGVVTFAEEPSLDVPLESARGLQDLAFRLLSLQSGGNTDLYGAMRLGATVLAAERSPIRHMIVLTDGGQNVGAPIFGPLVQQLNAAGITLTLVGLGYGHDEQLLKRIWQFSARGTYVPVDTARELPTILTRDTMRVAEDRSREARAMARIPDEQQPRQPPPAPRPPQERETPPTPRPPGPRPSAPEVTAGGGLVPLRLLRPHEATAGVGREGLPQVGPPRAATGVPGAALLMAREDGTIVLAAGRFGLGRSLAWLLPPDDPGANGWSDLGALLVQGVRAVLAPRGTSPAALAPEVGPGPDGEVLRIDGPDGGDPEPISGEWRGTAADGTPLRRPLSAAFPDEEIPLPAGKPGSLATILLQTARGERLPAVTYAVRGEQVPGERPGDATRLADLLGRGPADPARVGAEVEAVRRTRRTPVWGAFLLAAVLLLPLDVAAHRRSAPPPAGRLESGGRPA